MDTKSIRGGSWVSNANGLPCAVRGRGFPVIRYDVVGFRVVCTADIKVLRGGAWINVIDFLPCTFRDRASSSTTHFSVGFRIVRARQRCNHVIGFNVCIDEYNNGHRVSAIKWYYANYPDRFNVRIRYQFDHCPACGANLKETKSEKEKVNRD